MLYIHLCERNIKTAKNTRAKTACLHELTQGPSFPSNTLNLPFVYIREVTPAPRLHLSVSDDVRQRGHQRLSHDSQSSLAPDVLNAPTRLTAVK